MIYPEKFYREYWNDFLTVAGIAEYYGITEDKANDLINKGRIIHNRIAKQLKK